MKSYQISFDPSFINTPYLLQFFDSRSEILNWYTPFSGTIFIVSSKNQKELANLLAAHYTYYNNFIITEVNAHNTDGRLPPHAWNFINNPKSSGKWDSYNALYNNPYSNKYSGNHTASSAFGLALGNQSNQQTPTSAKTIADLLYGGQNQKK